MNDEPLLEATHASALSPNEAIEAESLGSKLSLMIDRLPPEGGITLAEIRDMVGKDSLLLLVIFLTLVFLVPVSIPGVSTVFGAGILLIGVSRFFNRNLWLPRKVSERNISTDKLQASFERALVWFRRLEKLSKPHRLKWLTTAGPVTLFNNASFILAALLLMAPFGFIPFSNTFPAVALIFFAIGMLQRDGGCILLGHLGNVVTIIYFTALIAGGGVAIGGTLQYILSLFQ